MTPFHLICLPLLLSFHSHVEFAPPGQAGDLHIKRAPPSPHDSGHRPNSAGAPSGGIIKSQSSPSLPPHHPSLGPHSSTQRPMTPGPGLVKSGSSSQLLSHVPFPISPDPALGSSPSTRRLVVEAPKTPVPTQPSRVNLAVSGPTKFGISGPTRTGTPGLPGSPTGTMTPTLPPMPTAQPSPSAEAKFASPQMMRTGAPSPALNGQPPGGQPGLANLSRAPPSSPDLMRPAAVRPQSLAQSAPYPSASPGLPAYALGDKRAPSPAPNLADSKLHGSVRAQPRRADSSSTFSLTHPRLNLTLTP